MRLVGWKASEKQKFPDHLRPAVERAGRAAYKNDMWTEDFFDALCACLPYNRFTLKVGQTPWWCRSSSTLRSLCGSPS